MLKNKNIKKETGVTSSDDVARNDVRENAIMRMNRRTFVKVAGATVGALALGRFGFHLANAQQGVPLPGNKIPKFVDELPELHITDSTSIELQMRTFLSPVMPSTFVPAAGIYNGTWVWGYLDKATQIDGNGDLIPGNIPSYIGPVIVATRGTPTEVKYVNNLGSTPTSVQAWDTSTDQTLHWADPKGLGHMTPGQVCTIPPVLGDPPQCFNYSGPIPAVPHLHGGEVPPQLDGGPDAWFTSDGVYQGHSYYTRNATDPPYSAVYRYPNKQEAAPLWFHDHALGITRLNVYAGLAGAYIIDDPNPEAQIPTNLPDLIPLVIQDRMFDVNGQLFFPNIGINPEHPFWIPEFIGDTIVVNGKVWPYKAVEKRRYRLLFLNGSNARAYDMSFIDRVSGVRGPRMWVIGTDGGYLDTPVLIDPNTTNKAVPKSLVIMPGERYEVIVDFNDPVWLGLLAAAGVTFPLNTLELQNTAKTPFPGGGPAPKNTTGRIMQFRVSAAVPADTSFDPTTLAPLRAPMVRLFNAATLNPSTGLPAQTWTVRRQLTLNEVMGPGGPLEVLVNNTRWGGHSVATDRFTDGIRPDFTLDLSGNSDTYYSELPIEGDTELWEIINLTADAHPIHLHLVQFQLVSRQRFDVAGYNAAYNTLFPGSSAIDPMTGAAFPPNVFIGGFGPPANYDTGKVWSAIDTFGGAKVTTYTGGNPDVAPFLNAKKWPAVPALPYEAGWKDTVIMYPGEVTRIVVRYAPTDLAANTPAANAYFPFDPNGGHGYVWHCHIIDHEDNEMMRPKSVTPNPNAPDPRDYVKGTDY